MCGIAGVFRPSGGDAAALADRVSTMTGTLAHRGPDAGGLWTDAAAGVSFGHRRLSILDLTTAGAQPMRSADGRFTITYNGEIYNHLDIRADLESAGAAPNWAGHSDTETLLVAIRHWGVKQALNRFNGMFAFALWDARDGVLTLCRDRFGEKPLFYGWVGRDLVFASELKAFAVHPDWHGSVDREALTAYMRYSYVPTPLTIWQGVSKLAPGTLVCFSGCATAGEDVKPEAYWSMRQHVVDGQQARLADPVQATEELERLLSQAVQRQSISDVSLGAFLSGGIDSSTIVALMQKHSTRPVRTFSIGFAESDFNEAANARCVAEHLGTDHTEWIVASSDARALIPRMAEIYDEPFGDSSQVPTTLVATLARRHVTVALSGDAGDELFGGYNRHVWGARLHQRFGALPLPVRKALAGLIGAVAPEPANTVGRLAGRMLPQRYRIPRVGDRLSKIRRIVDAGTFDEMYRLLSSIEDEPASIIIGGAEPESWFNGQMAMVDVPIDPLDRMTLSDTLSYLTDDILQKIDRAAMSVGLETRVPFLDRDVAEFSCRLPPDFKVRDGQGKWLVRQVLDRHVPKSLIDRPKTGFGIPLDDWLRGPLKGWASDLLAGDRLRRQGWFDAGRVEAVWTEHLQGRRNHGSWLWNVLMAQGWADQWCRP
ncbi:asparagine synthase (glutamine-hydrolyzing) [Tardiphaga sp.]|uniref:asparagine synthase (glutamine-hydrolyzing) n=1 Tax=Tardiphaga sp. TaxID=1926292 RepID=UPI0025DCD4E6|nr:asparagine synthase (glutamine-hydrolyzing) [Tardiphaga sp.]